MPVTDGVFTSNVPLVAAEQVVRWQAVNRTILIERDRIEKALAPLSRRLGYAVGSGLHAAKLTNELQQKFAAHLTRVYRFGMAEARRELADLRSREAASAPALAAR